MLSIKFGGPGQTANPVDHSHRMVDCGGRVVLSGIFLSLGPMSPNYRSGDHGRQIIATSLR